MKAFVVIVTGCNGYLGSQICRELKESIKSTVIIGIDIHPEPSGSAIDHFFSFDLALLDQIPDLVCRIQNKLETSEEFGGDYTLGLVNNAAFYGTMEGWGVDFLGERPQAWEQVFRVNLFAPFFLCQSLCNLLKIHQGRIVNISSIAGIVAPQFDLYEGTDMTNEAAYGTSKAGMNQLTRWLASRFAGTVRVNAICPGGIFRNQNIRFVEKYENRTLSGRMSDESDIADVVCFLISDKSRYINGQVLAVDGGWTAI